MNGVKTFYRDLMAGDRVNETEEQQANDEHWQPFLAFCMFDWAHTTSGQCLSDPPNAKSIAVCT